MPSTDGKGNHEYQGTVKRKEENRKGKWVPKKVVSRKMVDRHLNDLAASPPPERPDDKQSHGNRGCPKSEQPLENYPIERTRLIFILVPDQVICRYGKDKKGLYDESSMMGRHGGGEDGCGCG